MDLFNAAESRLAKEIGMDRAAYCHNNYDWVHQAREVARMLAAKNGSITINDVLKICPRPEHVSPNATGSIFSGKEWSIVGRTKTDKVSGHNREIKIWALK